MSLDNCEYPVSGSTMKGSHTGQMAPFKTRGPPFVIWLIWGIPTCSLCAVILYVNVENANVAKRIRSAGRAAGHTGDLNPASEDRARCVHRDTLTGAHVAVRDKAEVDNITERYVFDLVNFSPYRNVAAAQQQMSVTNLWLREYGKYLPEHSHRFESIDMESQEGSDAPSSEGPDSGFTVTMSSSSHSNDAVAQGQPAPSSSASKGSIEGVRSPLTSPTVVETQEAGRERTRTSSESPKGGNAITSSVRSAAKKPQGLVRRTATIVAAFYPAPPEGMTFDLWRSRASEFVKTAVRCAGDAEGSIFIRQPNRVVIYWGASKTVRDHESRGLNFMQHLEKELEKCLAPSESTFPYYVIGITGAVVVGFVKAKHSRVRVVLGDCMTVISEMETLLSLHHQVGLRGCCAWLTPAAAAETWPHEHHVPYDLFAKEDGGEYVLYRVLELDETGELTEGREAARSLREAFSAFRLYDYATASRLLEELGAETGYSKWNPDELHSRSRNEKITFAVWERLRLWSSWCRQWGLQYRPTMPHWSALPWDDATLAHTPNANESLVGETPITSLRAAQPREREGFADSHRREQASGTAVAEETSATRTEGTVVEPRVSSSLPHAKVAPIQREVSTFPQRDVSSSSVDESPLIATERSAGKTSLASQQGVSKPSDSNRSGPLRDFSDAKNMQFRLTNTCLGATATNKVMLGLSVESGALVAVKRIHYASEPLTFQERRRKLRDGVLIVKSASALVDEINIMAVLRSPTIVGYVTVVDRGNEFLLVMEYVSGGSLASVRDTYPDRKLPLWLAQRYLREVLEGLKYLHKRDTLHCDIKPQNVLVPDAGPCKLADFGIARSVSKTSNTRAATNGTLQYRAPEADGGEVTVKSDIYSFGVMAYELVTGRDPAVGSPMKPFSLPTNATEDEGLEDVMDVVRRCTAKEATERPTLEQLLGMPFFSDASLLQ